jgi:hypothetical protein
MKEKEIKKYKLLQLPEEVHKMLKEYCNTHGFLMSGYVSALIRQSIKGKK